MLTLTGNTSLNLLLIVVEHFSTMDSDFDSIVGDIEDSSNLGAPLLHQIREELTGGNFGSTHYPEGTRILKLTETVSDFFCVRTFSLHAM